MPHSTNWVVAYHHVVADFVAVDVEHHVPKDLDVVAADPGYLPYHHGAENAAAAAVEPSLLPLIPCRCRCFCC